jgi:hypothetical protein
MRSDDMAARALEALKRPRERFHSAVVRAVEEVRAFLDAHRPVHDGARSVKAALELGPFAGGRIDPARFGAALTPGAPLDAYALLRVEAALGELTRVAAAGVHPFRVEVQPHSDLHMVVAHALASVGRAFGAAQAVELIRSGRWNAEAHGALLEPFPFRRWNRAERQIAPPLVVEVDGAALHAGGLAEFLDGAQKLVLIVRGAAPPAALARLITPGVFVMQTADPEELARLAEGDEPGVAALVPETAACFVHDPAAGRTTAERLDVRHLPEATEVTPLDGYGAFTQAQELALLRELAAPPPRVHAAPVAAEAEDDAGAGSAGGDAAGGAPEASPAAGESPADPVDQLAGWLLRQAGLDGQASAGG